MTNITIFRDNSANIVRAELSGHTGFAEEGSDIVCSSVSTALYMALAGIEKLLGVDFSYETADGFASFALPDQIDDNLRKNINILLESMCLFFRDLQSQYPDNVSLTELEV